MKIGVLVRVGLFLAVALAAPAGAGTLDAVKQRGVLRCGVDELGTALSSVNHEGRWVGFYADICRAFAAAVAGSADRVEFFAVSTVDRFDALRAAEFDVLSEASTITTSRDGSGLAFPAIFLMDGQGFLVQKQAGFKALGDLKGRRICVQSHSTSVGGLAQANAALGMNFAIQEFASIEGAFAAFFDRQCDAVSTDVLIMAAMRQSLAPVPADYVFLPDRISREPLSPVVRDGDSRWEDVVRWVVAALITAEELGVDSTNIGQHLKSGNPEIRRLLGEEGDIGASLGLDARWAYRIIEQVGNYGEIYARTLTSALGLERGPNALYSKGGVLWAPPIR